MLAQYSSLNATTPQRTKQVRTKGNTISSIRVCACHKSGLMQSEYQSILQTIIYKPGIAYKLCHNI